MMRVIFSFNKIERAREKQGENDTDRGHRETEDNVLLRRKNGKDVLNI